MSKAHRTVNWRQLRIGLIGASFWLAGSALTRGLAAETSSSVDVTFAEGPNAPPLGLRVEGQAPVSQNALEEEISRVVGRPIASVEGARDGLIVVSFAPSLPNGEVSIRVSYEPPAEQLTRSTTVHDGSHVASAVAELVQSLLRQDAGVTLVVPEAETRSIDDSSVTRAPVLPPASDAEPRSTPREPTASTWQSWQVRAGVRWVPHGSAATHGHDAGGRLEDLTVLGGSLQVLSPTNNRFRLAFEGVIDFVDVEGNFDGRKAMLSGGYGGISVMPMFTFWRTRHGLEATALAHLGIVSAGFDIEGFTESPVDTQNDIGYRAGVALDLSYGFDDHFALNAALGLEQVAVDVYSARYDEQSGRFVRHDIGVWFKQPNLRLGFSYAF